MTKTRVRHTWAKDRNKGKGGGTGRILLGRDDIIVGDRIRRVVMPIIPS